MDVKKTIDNVDKLNERMRSLTMQEVWVGIPAQKTGRKEGPITNASIAYVHEFGSPAHNIPARPFLRPGVRNAQDDIAVAMRKGAKEVMEGEQNAASRALNTVGMIARNSVVRAITNPVPPFVPLKPATIRARLRRTQAGRRKLAQLQKQGIPLVVWAKQLTESGSPNIQPLLDTLQLRSAITYVVRPYEGQPRATYWGFQRDYGRIMTTVRR